MTKPKMLSRSFTMTIALGVASAVTPVTVVAGDLHVVAPAIECGAIADRDFTKLPGASSRIDKAEIVKSPTGAEFCKVTGYVASAVQFEISLPAGGWTQRFLMLGCGGYCGAVRADPKTSGQRMTAGCAPLESGQMVVASTDLGHKRVSGLWPDGIWAQNNPMAVVDFAYAGMHKTTLITKAVIEAYYGQRPRYSYFVGCSDGGREALQEAQRFPEDFDGIVAGAPVIDEVTTNTFYHAWGVRTNTDTEGKPILTHDKVPTLARAVAKACGDVGGLIQDPRACKFDAKDLLCKAGDGPDCLTAAQVEVTRKLYEGPRDTNGTFLAARGMPLGSELGWIGTMIPKEGVSEMSHRTLGDAAWSNDFPNYMSSFGAPTGITYENMRFDRETFDRLHELSGLYDPTNPDLSAFAKRGGKLILWTGWADSGVSPYISLNYYNAVRETMGAATNDMLTFYALPGVFHCSADVNPTRQDFLTPLMAWVEDGRRPDQVVVEFMKTDDEALRTRPVFPYPSMVKYKGEGDINDHTSFVKAELPSGLPQKMDWVGLENYQSGRAMWCDMKAGSINCERR